VSGYAPFKITVTCIMIKCIKIEFQASAFTLYDREILKELLDSLRKN
jgi:hypothetical protein